MSLPIDNWMIAWNPPDGIGVAKPGMKTAGAVEVGPYPDYTRWSDAYVCSVDCCYGHWSKLKTTEQKIDELIRGCFLLVLGQGLDPAALHREFSKIEGCLEYRATSGSAWARRSFSRREGFLPITRERTLER